MIEMLVTNSYVLNVSVDEFKLLKTAMCIALGWDIEMAELLQAFADHK